MVALLASIFALGCGPKTVRLDEPNRVFTAEEYDEALDDWTRRSVQYENFESRIFAVATYRSWPFRQAQIARRIEKERLPGADAAALRASEQRGLREGHDFFLAVHTHEWSWNHLERTEGDSAIWQLRLINDKGAAIGPESVERIGLRDPRYSALYPFYEEFYVGYLVRFPRRLTDGRELIMPNTRRFTVRISGAQGAVDLTWEVRQ